MRYRRAVEKLRILADACQRTTRWPPDDEPFLREVYVFGEVLDGADPVDHIELAMVLNLPSEKVPWESEPHGTGWLVHELRLDKGGFAYWWRSRQDRCGTTSSGTGSVLVARRPRRGRAAGSVGASVRRPAPGDRTAG